MAAPSRSSQFVKLHKILKKHYKPVAPDSSRPVLEQLLFACCLENAPYEAAEESFAALVHNFYDWNEIRVSTARELAEVMPGVPDPAAAANRVKRVLQSVFETTYTFDLEELRKLNLGPATEKLGKLAGASKFAVAYVVQSALGGHAIPIDQGAAQVLEITELISEEESKELSVAGLERAIPKNKGVEFGSLLHQLAADFVANPFAARVRDILVEISPQAAERLPRRRAKKEDAAGSKPAAEPKPAAESSKDDGGRRAKPTDKAADKPADKPTDKAAKSPRGKKLADEPVTPPADEGHAETREAADGPKRPAAKKRSAGEGAEVGKKESTRRPAGISKRKPR